MRCRHKANRLLAAYDDKGLTDAEVRMVEDHLAQCKYCMEELEDFRKMYAWFSQFRIVYPTEERFNQIYEDARKRVEMKRQLKQDKKSMFIISQLRTYLQGLKSEVSFVLLSIDWERVKPAVISTVSIVFLISGILFLKVTSSQQSKVYFLPSMVANGTVKVWHEKDTLVFEPELGEEFIIDTSDNARIRFKTPNAQVEAGSNTQLYLKPEKDKPTTVGVVYAYDSVSLLTKHSSTNLSSGTTAYVYPDGTVSKPEKISEVQLKKWQDKLEGEKRDEQKDG